MTADRDLFGDAIAPAKAVRLGRRVFLASPVRAQAERMRAEGASLETIADAIGVSVWTIRTRLADALERGLPGGRGAGRPQWQPSAECRDKVARLASEGLTQVEIAEALGVSAPTLRRHCAAELADGRRSRRTAADE